jgi:hypothetical protein
LQELEYEPSPVPVIEAVRSGQHERRWFVRLAESVADRDLALLDSPALDCIRLDLLYQDFHDAPL